MPRKNLKVFFAIFLTMFLVYGEAFGQEAGVTARARYVFLFIGDGMGVAQRTAAELFVADKYHTNRPEEARLVMNTFPAQGMTTTYDLSSVIPDSASTSTAIACGHKTRSGVIGMDGAGAMRYENIVETARKKNFKVGILSTVSLDHATPAAFYAHVPSRKQMYDISLQLAKSGVEYFAGGQLLEPVDKKDPGRPNAIEVAKQHGYTVAIGRAQFEALKPGIPKVIAMSGLVDQNAAMYYTLDQNQEDREQISLAQFLDKGIQLLMNPKGFFIMVEAGKIDWACHANDAAASIQDTLALDQAVAVAVRFYQKHPWETLIIVTGDHETGGMTIGFAGTQYSCFVGKLQQQKMSYQEFDQRLNKYKKAHTLADAKFADILPLIKEAFGLGIVSAEDKAVLEKAVCAGKNPEAPQEIKDAAQKAAAEMECGLILTDLELKVLQEAFQQSLGGAKERAKDDYTNLMYGGYEPLTVKSTTILNNKAGIGWTTYSHSGVPVQTSALGVGAPEFNGYYDQTDIYRKIMSITDLNQKNSYDK
jgi:alkaline phosphatase